MDYQKQIAAYQPFNKQEKQDKKSMLAYLETSTDLLTRENKEAHFTASAWVVNPLLTKTVMAYHNIYQSWAWLGGHADGEADFLKVAMQEVTEETGLQHLKAASPNIFSLEILAVPAHLKNGETIASHLHLNLTYLLIANEEEPLQVKPDENSAVAWLGLEEAVQKSNEPEMKDIYQKLNEKVMQWKDAQR